MNVYNSMRGKDYGAAIERGIVKGLDNMGRAIAGQAQADAPRDTGRLAGSIDYATKRKAGKDVSQPKDEYTLHVGTNVKYAPAQEYGTRYMEAQPYLRPALDRNRSAEPVKRAISDEMKKENARG